MKAAWESAIMLDGCESDFTAYSESIFHFVQVEVTADELTLHAIDRDGEDLDSVVIPRE